MSGDFSGKVSIVTGASSGLGLAIAAMFAKKGAKVTLCGRDADRLTAAKERCTEASGGHGDRFITVQGDVSYSKVREDIVSRTIEAFGCLDILVANAGTTVPNIGIRTASEESFDRVFSVNLKSVFFLIQTALPHLEKSKGNIVTMSSMLSTLVTHPNFLYGVTKAALDHVTRCLALDLGPKGIRVNAVNPSIIPTMLLRTFTDTPSEALAVGVLMAENERSLQPLEAKYGHPDDVANTVCFLASDAGKFITGECLKVDGGRTFRGAFEEDIQNQATGST